MGSPCEYNDRESSKKRLILVHKCLFEKIFYFFLFHREIESFFAFSCTLITYRTEIRRY